VRLSSRHALFGALRAVTLRTEHAAHTRQRRASRGRHSNGPGRRDLGLARQNRGSVYSLRHDKGLTMPIIPIDCPEPVLIALKEDAQSFARDIRLTAAMKFFELGRLSSGRAAELAGLTRVEFLRRTGEFKVSAIDESTEELETDRDNA
jgi:predicted HTH domain antitoxin